MAWLDEDSADTAWQMELLRTRQVESEALFEPVPLFPTSVDDMQQLGLLQQQQHQAAANLAAAENALHRAGHGHSHGHSALQQQQQQQHQSAPQLSSLTYSASCPSFTSLYDLSADQLFNELAADEQPPAAPMAAGIAAVQAGGAYPAAQRQIPPPYGYQRSSSIGMGASRHAGVGSMPQRHPSYPYNTYGAPQIRRQLQTSASFTSLTSMETEYRRRFAVELTCGGGDVEQPRSGGKALIYGERILDTSHSYLLLWFDQVVDSTTTTMPSPVASMECLNYSATSSPFQSTPENHPMEDASDTSEMIGFSIDDFPTTITSDAQWPAPASTAMLQSSRPPRPHPGNASASQFAHTDGEVMQEGAGGTGLFLTEQDRDNVSRLLESIDPSEFEKPTTPLMTESNDKSPKKDAASPSAVTSPVSSSAPDVTEATIADSINVPSPHQIEEKGPSPTTPTTTDEQPKSPSAGPDSQQQQEPENAPEPIYRRIQQILASSKRGGKPSQRVQLSASEFKYMSNSPLFLESKVQETAGSLWLLLHAANCANGCAISGCQVMHRVVKHCSSCEAALGKCQDTCNGAKAMLLHFGSCTSLPGSSTPCSVCESLVSIDKAHNALRSPRPDANSSATVTSAPSPVAPSPQPAKPATTGTKHVPIQPNPLPTTSNPMGLMSQFPQFGCPLSLYLEQTSPTFRAELKYRIEKRVTAAAGQDLLHHMQKKTRLRSLDDLRAEARTLVLAEMERELHFHMQAINWASMNNSTGGDNGHLPSYLLSVAAAGFAAFYTQQATNLQGLLAQSGVDAAQLSTDTRKTSEAQSSMRRSSSASHVPDEKNGKAALPA
ncbi:TPA: hypothetical protein N0F65_000761 [Lagenidium giganteum]|uniref:TAZ-type domain-containing protein n=1 Tax=Lagenidium giganteum TaxID=4803 RepID=A0AAV2ZL08_9STRA|nr:TPA: hypothetical protein N0F65_000761 [Lagenidium giganteum]